MGSRDLKERVNFILFECQNRQMTDEEKEMCKTRIERLKDEIKFNENEIKWITSALANER